MKSRNKRLLRAFRNGAIWAAWLCLVSTVAVFAAWLVSLTASVSVDLLSIGPIQWATEATVTKTDPSAAGLTCVMSSTSGYSSATVTITHAYPGAICKFSWNPGVSNDGALALVGQAIISTVPVGIDVTSNLEGLALPAGGVSGPLWLEVAANDEGTPGSSIGPFDVSLDFAP